jgi:ketosteroid isomerase-like protein
MDHPNIDLVLGVYGAYMNGDRDVVLAALAPDVRWHNSGTDPTAGTLEGPAAVLDHLLGDDHMADYRLDVVDVLASDQRVAIVAAASGRRGEATITNEFVQLVRVADGKVAEVWNYYWDQAGLAAFMDQPMAAAGSK